MSLLTDALRLREGRRPARMDSGPSLPPFRGQQTGRWILVVCMLCVVVGLGFWKGDWMMEKLEESAGIPSEHLKTDLMATAPRRLEILKKEDVKALQPKQPELVQAADSGVPNREGKRPVVEQKAAPVKSDPGLSTELVKQTPNPMEKETGKSTMPAMASVPNGELQPMKVDLVEMQLALEKPEEREKKRIDGVEAYLRSLQVQGVRLQGADSRILVDGSAIGLGEKVGSMGLVLEKVEPQKIIFSDVAGKKYPKSY